MKRMLKLPKHHSDTAAITALEMPNHEKQVVGDKVGFRAAGDGEQFRKTQWLGFGGTL